MSRRTLDRREDWAGFFLRLAGLAVFWVVVWLAVFHGLGFYDEAGE